MKTPEEMAAQYIKDVEIARNPSVTVTAFPQMQRCYVAGYKAAQPQWISVCDELPSCENYLGSIDVSKCVLIYTTDKIISVAHLTKHLYNLNPMVWAKCNCDYLGLTLGEEEWAPNEVTHWMPLPEAPKEEE